MPNPNPVRARLAQRRRRKPGDLRGLQKAVWQALRDCEAALELAETNGERCAAIHAMAAISNSYSRLLLVGEYDARIAALETQMERLHRARFSYTPGAN